MYLPVPSQRDPISGWLNACQLVDAKPAHEAFDVIICVEKPVLDRAKTCATIARINEFLGEVAKPISTVANTIFPHAIYEEYETPKFWERLEKILLRAGKNSDRWTGYYIERMTHHTDPDGKTVNPLRDIIDRMKDPKVSSKNKFELPIFCLNRDVNKSPYGGQCLSFLSFKLTGQDKKTLRLTALYRNHYYIEKLLGNLIGLGDLMAFIAKEANLEVGSLTVISTHAVIDCPGHANRSDITALFDDVKGLVNVIPAEVVPE
jgi:hypothetical protein